MDNGMTVDLTEEEWKETFGKLPFKKEEKNKEDQIL